MLISPDRKRQAGKGSEKMKITKEWLQKEKACIEKYKGVNI